MAALGGAAIVTAVAASPPVIATQNELLISTDPALIGRFKEGVPDYVSHCKKGQPVKVSVSAPGGHTVSVDGGQARSGHFTATVAVKASQAFAIRVSSAGRAFDYHVRCLPRSFPSWRVTRGGTPQVQWYLLSPSGHYAAFFNGGGIPLWWIRTKDQPFNPTLLPDGNLAWYSHLGGRIGTSHKRTYEEHRLDGSLVRRLTTIGPPTDLHEIQQLANGNYLLDTYPKRGGVDLRPYGGPRNATVYDAEVQEITPRGQLVWRWSSRGRIDLSETGHRWWRSIIEGQKSVPQRERVYDPIHINSIEVDGGTIVVSLRHDDAIYAIEKATGRIQWKLGGTRTPKSLTILGDRPYASTTFGGQHDVRVLPDGTLTVYDNSTYRTRRPRAVRYRIDTANRTATLLEQVTYSGVEKSRRGGGARKLAGGDWVISWGGGPWVTELSRTGHVVFTMRFPGLKGYRVDPIPPGVVSAAALRSAMDRMHPRK